MSLEVVRPGPLALVEDAGRPGLAAVGVSPSGAFDRSAFAAGARLVGNDSNQAAIELVLGGLSVRALSEVTVALTGAMAPLDVDGAGMPWATALQLTPGQVLTLGMAGTGLRSYLSVAGGIDVPPVLGSRSSDLLSGLGPPQLLAGTVLPVGPTPNPEAVNAATPTVPTELAEAGRRHEGPVELLLLPGPRTDWLADPAALAGDWTVTPNSNRVGVRLTGTPLERAPGHETAELPSEPLVRGAVQLPPSGHPVIFGPDHPTTGGYPVVGVLTEAASDRLAQCRPGNQVHLAWAVARTAG